MDDFTIYRANINGHKYIFKSGRKLTIKNNLETDNYFSIFFCNQSKEC